MFVNSTGWMSGFWKSITRRATALGVLSPGSPAQRRQRQRRGMPVAALESRTLLAAFVVTSAADNTTVGDGLTTLREAVLLANGSAGADTITFGDGSAVLGGTDFTDGLADTITLSLGHMAISQTVTITGQSAASTIISGNNVSRMFSITFGDTTLEKLTLKSGRTTGNNVSSTDDTFNGGAIRSLSTGSLMISQCTLSGNSTGGYSAGGGAVFAINGAVTVSRSTLSGNFTTGNFADGGAIYSKNGAVTVSQSKLSGNSTAGQDANGGAIYSNFGAVTVSQSTFSGNKTTGSYAYGGAITSLQAGQVTITSSTLSGNQVLGTGSSRGGGALWSNHGEVSLTNSTITGNTAKNGGGVDIHGITASNVVTIRNSILAGNTATTNPDFATLGNPGVNLSVRSSLIGNNTGITLVLPATVGSIPDANGNFVGSGATPINPLLGPLQNNGGATLTHAVLAGSLALNSGNNTLIPLDTLDLDGDSNIAEQVPFDQRGVGFGRIAGGTVEMGAFEVSLIVDTNVDENDGNFAPGDLSLREAIGLANLNPGADTITFGDGSGLGGTNFTDGVADTILLSLGEMSIDETVTITGQSAANTIIDGNNASRIFSITSGDTTLEKLTLTGGRTIADNAAGRGGAIYSISTGTLTVSQSTLSGNSTTGNNAHGGAIFALNGAVTVSQSTLSGNSTTGNFTYGGGGAVCAVYGAVAVIQSTLSGNSTAGIGANGGAIYSYSGAVTVSQSSLTGNQATLAAGGSIFSNSSPVTIQNSIVAGNTDSGTAPDIRKSPTDALTVSHSLIGNNTGTDLTEAQTADGSGNFIGSATGSGIIDPQLGPLQDNGGSTFTHAVLTGSLALSSGDNTLIPLDALDLDGDLNTVEPVPFDQRGIGFARIDGGTVDMGAFENNGIAPTVTITMADTALLAGETSLVTFTFSEPVIGFTNADLTIANGTLTPVSSVDGGVTWTATFTPTASVTDITNRIRLNTALITDLGGNAGVGITSSPNYTINTVRPTVVITLSDTALLPGETSLVTFTFSEVVTGFTNADLLIANGTLTPVASANGGLTWTATFTPNVNVNDTTNVITLNKTLIANLAGNAGSGTTSSPNYVIDAIPTVVITLADTALKAGETSLVTFTFNEAVTGFTNADLTIANGTLTAVASVNGGLTWKATFTPTVLVTDATNVITLNTALITDLTGNAGVGTASSPNYRIDTRRPTVVITLADTALKAGETSLVTFTFNEAVIGFTSGDLSQIENGTLTAVASANGGVTWTATFTPRVNITDLTNVITLNNTLFTDLSGNAGTGTTSSANYTVQTRRPTVIITRTDSALRLGETSLFTFTFSEAITGFDNTDLTIENGTLTAVVSVNGGVTWTATFTPTSFVTDLTNKITLNNTGYSNSAGNTGVGTTSSLNYSIDT